jgi:hypothetical protein
MKDVKPLKIADWIPDLKAAQPDVANKQNSNDAEGIWSMNAANPHNLLNFCEWKSTVIISLYTLLRCAPFDFFVYVVLIRALCIMY